MNRCFATAALIFVLSVVTSAQNFPHPQVVLPNEFMIMPWDEAPSRPELLQGIKDAGLNTAGFCHAEEVERVRAAGLVCILQDERLTRLNWENLPSDLQLHELVADLQRQFGTDPTVFGFFLSDEPRTAEMGGLGRVSALLRQAMPGKLPYVNLFPYREAAENRWYTNYEQYARSLATVVHQPFLSFDNYSLVYGQMGDEFFSNLEVVRRVSIESKIPFWSCVQAVAHFGYTVPTDATFNLQAYSTLAYGGRGIQYFTYFTPERGNYRMGALDQFGNKTSTWDALRRINYQIHALAPTLIRLTSTGVYHYPDVPKQGRPLADSHLVRWIEMVKDEDGYSPPSVAARFLVGEFQDEKGRPYLMIVNKDLTYSFRFEIAFKREIRNMWRLDPYSGKEEALAGEQNWLAPGGGVLLRLE